jgi:VanZ family protein
MRILVILIRSAAVAACLAVIYFSLTPNPPQPLRFNGVDKLEHGLAYLLTGGLFCLGFLPAKPRAFQVLTCISCIVLMGSAIELVQPIVGRNFDWFDMAFNAAGVVIGYALSIAPRRLLHRKPA